MLLTKGMFVAVVLADIKEAFNSVSHNVLEIKLQRGFGISGPLL